jgi:hypothetical protein
MNLQEFLKLNTRDKLSSLWENGKFLRSRIESTYSISIYKWNNYIMEIWYLIPNAKIEKIELAGEAE